MIIVSCYEGTVRIEGVDRLTKKIKENCLGIARNLLSNFQNNKCLSYLNNVEIFNDKESYKYIFKHEDQGRSEDQIIDIECEYYDEI